MKISDAALAQLDSLAFTGPDPWAAKIIAKLDRKIYNEINAALEAVGGEWNRKAKAHLFETDPRPALEQMILTGFYLHARKDFGFFPTPEPLAKDLVRLAALKAGQQVLEPSAGDGAIVREILALGLPSLFLWAVEIREDCRKALGTLLSLNKYTDNVLQIADFLSWEPPIPGFDRIVMNPPFSGLADAQHVLRAYKMLKPGGRLVSVVSAGAMFRTTTVARSLQSLVEAHGYAAENDPEAFIDSGTRVRTVTIGITKPYGES